MNYTLKLFNTGQVTLPKLWRNKYPTKHFLATETKQGLLIRPIVDDDEYDVKQIIGSKVVETDKDGTVYYEDEAERGLYFPDGMDPQVLIDKITALQHG